MRKGGPYTGKRKPQLKIFFMKNFIKATHKRILVWLYTNTKSFVPSPAFLLRLISASSPYRPLTVFEIL